MFSLSQFKRWADQIPDSKIVVTAYSPDHFTIDCLRAGKKISVADRKLRPIVFPSIKAVKKQLAEHDINLIYLDYDAEFNGERSIEQSLWQEGLLVMALA